MLPRDPPLWARAAAVGLLLFASWWLLHTEALRSIVGDSIALLSLGVISVFVLRGLHLPLGIWLEGPWRDEFDIRAVVGCVAIFAVSMLLGAPRPDVSRAVLDVGLLVLILAGGLGWGYACGFVRQRSFGSWYGLAAFAGFLPFVLGVLTGGSADQGLCLWSTGSDAAGESVCVAAAIPSFLFFSAVGAAVALVTQELAFRRLLIGSSTRAGLLPIAVAAVAALGWHAVVAWSGLGDSTTVWLGAIGALTAGSLYVLSGSLLTSALYTGMMYASSASQSVALSGSGQALTQPVVPAAVWIGTILVAVTLAGLVVRRNGFVGDFLQRDLASAPSE